MLIIGETGCAVNENFLYSLWNSTVNPEVKMFMKNKEIYICVYVCIYIYIVKGKYLV